MLLIIEFICKFWNFVDQHAADHHFGNHRSSSFCIGYIAGSENQLFLKELCKRFSIIKSNS